MMNLIQGMPLKETLSALDELIEITKSKPAELPVPFEGDYYEISKGLHDKLDKISRIKITISLEYEEREISSDSMLYMSFCRVNFRHYVRVNDTGSIMTAREFLKHHISMCERVNV